MNDEADHIRKGTRTIGQTWIIHPASRVRHPCVGAVLLCGLLLVSVTAQAEEKAQATMHELPHARGKAFASLDDYLAHLKTLGAVDIPYYEEVKPGFYRRVTRGADRRLISREELARRFGFPH